MEKLEYELPIQEKEKCDALNNELGTDFKDFEWHSNNLFEQITGLIQKCGDEGGWYIYDAIKVKVEVEYIPENK